MYKGIKAVLDEVMGIFLIIILLIPMIIIAILIKITSDGPVLFKQKRYGVYTTEFTIYKFRTMYVYTPEKSNQEFKDMDNFITPLGRILRKFSLDELPQLFNIVFGQMSFVGPRPLADSDYDVIKMRRENGANRVRPGITGLAQVNGRNNILDSDKAHFDAIYSQNCSLKVDIIIILKTVFNVVMAKDINRDRSGL